MNYPDHYHIPDWPAPPNVKAVSTYRFGGHSQAPFDTFNLGLHVGENNDSVIHNRNQLLDELALKKQPLWINQTHGTNILEINDHTQTSTHSFDASFTQCKQNVCIVLTADCLPVLLCDRKGSIVSAIHTGWRGLNAGILEKVVERLPVLPTDLLAWLGPGISQQHFEIGQEVKDSLNRHTLIPENTFIKSKQDGKWFADLYTLARIRLRSVGVTNCFGGNRCTFDEPDYFYSYRRDKEQAGRQATLIWME